MLTIALTGGIACGKSTVSAMLAQLGASIIDADEISRSLTAPNGPALPAIRKAFGDTVFHPDGTLDRAALSAVVFSDENCLRQLNAITHPLVRQQMEKQLEACRKNGAEVVILDVPLLFEANMQDMGDLTMCVTAPEEVQIARMASRNAYTREQALSRIRSQMPVQEKASRSQIVLSTDMPLDQLREAVAALYLSWRKEHA